MSRVWLIRGMERGHCDLILCCFAGASHIAEGSETSTLKPLETEVFFFFIDKLIG